MGNVTAALDLIIKYAGYIPIIVEAGGEIADLVVRIQSVAEGAKDGTLTDDQIAEHRKALDDLIADFNEPIG